MKFDDIIVELGEFGPYQKRVYALVCLSAVPMTIGTMAIIFTMATQKHRCAIPGLANDTYKSQGSWHDHLVKHRVPWDSGEDAYSSCKLFKYDHGVITNHTESCSHYVYDKSTFESTLVSEINMVCDDQDLTTYANMIYMVGFLFGSVILGSLADMIGRKKILIAGVIGHFCVSLGCAFVDSYAPFVILRFLIAFFGIGTFLSAFVVGVEVVGPSKRKFAGVIIQLVWVSTEFVIALMAYVIRDWKYLQIATSIPTVFLFSYAFLLPESPRWLIGKGRLDDALKVIQTVAAGNGVTLSEKVTNLGNLTGEASNEKVWGMFTNKTLLARVMIIFFNWAVVSLVYFGISYNVSTLSGNIFLNFFLSALVEGLAYIAVLVLLDRTGRKPLHCFNMLLAGVACLATMFPVMYGDDDTEWVTLVLSLVGKFGISGSFCIVYIYSAEIFPTTVRNSGLGVSSFSSRIGGIIAPYIGNVGNKINGHIGLAVPLIIFGGASVVAGLLSLFLPETTHRILPDSIQDAKNFGRKAHKRVSHKKYGSLVNEEPTNQLDEHDDNPGFHYSI